jgi:phosphatidylglycerol lysyltransferase
LQPVFTAVSDAGPYRQRGLWSAPVADDPVIDLAGFGLGGGRMASVRHSVASARRAGLRVVPWAPALTDGAAAVSAKWLATKRGGELGFTLGRFDPAALTGMDTRVALDCSGRVVGLVTWHAYGDGTGRVLDLMRRAPDAPNPTMDLLIAESLIEFAAAGVTVASLGSVLRSYGALAERVYPTVSLRRYKDKFSPRWRARHLVVPSRARLPVALTAVARAYCPEGLWSGLWPNH